MGGKFGRHFRNLRPKKRGVTERFLMVTVQKYEIRSSKPWCFQNNPKIFVRLFYHSSTRHNSVDTFCKRSLFFYILWPKDWPKCPSSSNTDENYTSDLTVKAKLLFPDREIMSRLVLYPFLLLILCLCMWLWSRSFLSCLTFHRSFHFQIACEQVGGDKWTQITWSCMKVQSYRTYRSSRQALVNSTYRRLTVQSFYCYRNRGTWHYIHWYRPKIML